MRYLIAFLFLVACSAMAEPDLLSGGSGDDVLVAGSADDLLELDAQ